MSFTPRIGLLPGSLTDKKLNNTTPVSLGQITGPDCDSGPLLCGICSRNLDSLTTTQRQEHYERHFSHDSSLNESNTTCLPTEITHKGRMVKNLKRNFKQFIEHDIFWYTTLPNVPPPNYTPGLILLLKKALWNSHGRGYTCRAVLCHERCVHISREIWDSGWGCGYRNFMMACTALMVQSSQPMYFSRLNDSAGPGIRNLQAWIESAWKDGFDPEGAQELKKLTGTSKWIGTGDLWVAFTFRGIPAELVDFDLRGQTDGFKVVVDWVVEYFSPKSAHQVPSSVNDALRGASPILVTDKMPLILQHAGHSRVIVGYEVSNSEQVNLLTFDSAYRPTKRIRQVAMSYSALPGVADRATKLTSSSKSGGSAQFQKRNLSSPEPTNEIKRLRLGSLNDQNNGLINPNDSSSSARQEVNEGVKGDNALFREVLGSLRVVPRRFGKKDYQILYFPMTAPLTDKERMQRTVVRSTKVVI